MLNFNVTIDLITNDRHIDISNTEMCVDLMKEFLRREALWAGYLCLTSEIPFANLAAAISAINYAEPYLERIKAYAYSVAESRCCSAMINWYGSINKSNIQEQSFPDPYQPLLQFFRLGGTFSREHQFFIHINDIALIQANTIQQ